MLALAFSVFQGAANPEVRVRVVDADLAPVAGAEVRWSTGKPERRDVTRIDESPDFVLTDEHGVAVLPEDVRPEVVVASAPGLWGWNRQTNASRPQLLVLERDGDLEVETVDREGRPLSDVPVILRRRMASRADSPGSGKPHAPSLRALARDADDVVETSSVGDANGRAVLRHALAIRAAVERYRGDHRWNVGLDPLGVEAASEAEVDPQAWTRGAVRLVLADTYDLHMTFVDDGRPVRSVERAVVVPTAYRRTDGIPATFSRWPDTSSRFRTLDAGGGAALLRHVDASYEPVLRVRRNPVSCATEAETIETGREGSRRSVTYELGRGLAKVRARVTREGTPLERVRVSGHRDSSGIAVELALDPPGELRLDLDPWDWRRGVLLSESGGLREAWIAPPTPGVPGPIELGEVALVLPPLALAGVVTDEIGAPLAGVAVVARKLEWRDQLGERTRVDDPVVHTLTDAQGQFALSTSIRGSFRLELSRSDAFSEVVEDVPHGSLGLHVVLRGPARLRGHVRFASESSAGDVEVLALRTDDGVPIERAPGIARGCSCEGLFEFENLKAGKYTLLVRRPSKTGKPIELARREGLVLAAGDTLDAGELRIE
jgi:hypothetical protein